MSYKHERALQIIASLNPNTQDLEDARRHALKALGDEPPAPMPDFETRGVLLKDPRGDSLGFALVFKTARDRERFVEMARCW
jgi:hypothetical protein